jgi:hypothetical protein
MKSWEFEAQDSGGNFNAVLVRKRCEIFSSTVIYVLFDELRFFCKFKAENFAILKMI